MSKLAGILSTLLLTLSSAVFAQSADEAAINRAMEALSKATTTVDKAALENIVWPEVSYGHSAGRIENKAQFVDALVSKKSIITKIETTKTTMSFTGDLAI